MEQVCTSLFVFNLVLLTITGEPAITTVEAFFAHVLKLVKRQIVYIQFKNY